MNEQAIAYISQKSSELSSALSERVSRQDPEYADAFVQCLGRLAAATRTALHSASVPAS